MSATSGQSQADTLIHAFVMSAEKDQMPLQGKFGGQILAERTSLGGHEDNPGAGRTHRFDRLEEWFRLHDHARPAAIWTVVDGLMAVAGKIAQVDDPESNGGLLGRALHDAFIKESPHHGREDRDNIDVERIPHRPLTQRLR